MNKKGQQLATVGTLLMTAIAIIIGLVLLYQSISGNVGTMTQKGTGIYNTTIAAAWTGAKGINLTYGFKLDEGCVAETDNWRKSALSECGITATVASNNGTPLAEGTDYILYETSACSNSTYDITYLSSLGINSSVGNADNRTIVTYTYCPDGYITNQQPGGRAVATIIVLLCALCIAIVALVPVLRNGLVDKVKGHT